MRMVHISVFKRVEIQNSIKEIPPMSIQEPNPHPDESQFCIQVPRDQLLTYAVVLFFPQNI